MHRNLHARGAALLVAVCAALALPGFAAAAVRGDFNGDGHADLAVGAPQDSVQGRAQAGAVNVLYGGPGGLTSRGNQQFTAATPRVAGVPVAGAHFGAALAAGDLDGDGHDDLAIGAPDAGNGAVIALRGTRGGLRVRTGLWNQGHSGVKGAVENGDRFGAALAIGHFDADRYGDLAVGVPGDDVGGAAQAGAVNVLRGGAGGLTADGDQLWTQDTDGVKGRAGTRFHFGAALAAGELSGNGRDDLAIGIPGGRISGQAQAGAVGVLYGRRGGLRADGGDLWSQDAAGVLGAARRNDRFGSAVAIGDFDADGIGDLAVGAPLDTVGNAAGAGVVHVLHGTRGGLSARRDQLWSQASAGVPGRASIGETFGSALAAGDLSANGADDLVVGSPGEQVSDAVSAGAVTVLYGRSGRGLTVGHARALDQDTRGVPGRAERDDHFGEALAIADFDGDGTGDLAAGAPGDRVAGLAGAGAVNVLRGGTAGLTPAGGQRWSQGSGGVLGAVGADHFGAAL